MGSPLKTSVLWIRTTLLFMVNNTKINLMKSSLILIMNNKVVLIDEIEAWRGEPTYQMKAQR